MNSTNTNNNNFQDMHQVYSAMMAIMGEAERNAFCKMPHSVCITFLICLCSGNSAHVDTKNVESGHVNTFNASTIVK
ncbi:hypothetical protein DSO57_1004474 [Entomophthora muscae]|uniref:Uncharacterized protein n=1 Tax=Entomophthora muscae TaxID=34485 RepID=A0ACC2UI67_9FUNG|nr:hypothetical protein DSO57_1004474 [Entomophthora muscae]